MLTIITCINDYHVAKVLLINFISLFTPVSLVITGFIVH